MDTDNPVNQSKLEANTCSRHDAREDVHEQVTIGFGFTSDWLRNWREIFKPITERGNTKPKQTRVTFDTQLKTTLYQIMTKTHNFLFFLDIFIFLSKIKWQSGMGLLIVFC